jgi:2-keto-4-pentenoate hydratase
MTDIDLAAHTLLEARRSGNALTALPTQAQPQSLAEAYAIQDAQLHALGAVGGWKVGAKSSEVQPNCAPLPQALVLPSPQIFAPDRFPLHLVEAELAFTLAHDLPPRPEAYSVDDVAAAIASVHAAIEIIGSRYTDFHAQPPFVQLADLQNNGALVVGAGRRLDTRIDQNQQAVQFFCDEVLDYEATGGNPAGDVFRLLAWLANHAAARCGGLRAGQVVTTGSCIGVRAVAPGTRVQAQFPGVGSVEVTL